MPEISNAFVVVLGLSVVFVGLICIILICKIMSVICNITGNKQSDKNASASAPTKTDTGAQPIQNRQEIIAAVSAAIAEELGTDISAIRILSFKKI